MVFVSKNGVFIMAILEKTQKSDIIRLKYIFEGVIDICYNKLWKLMIDKKLKKSFYRNCRNTQIKYDSS